jgi:hypothetical protein
VHCHATTAAFECVHHPVPNKPNMVPMGTPWQVHSNYAAIQAHLGKGHSHPGVTVRTSGSSALCTGKSISQEQDVSERTDMDMHEAPIEVSLPDTLLGNDGQDTPSEDLHPDVNLIEDNKLLELS